VAGDSDGAIHRSRRAGRHLDRRASLRLVSRPSRWWPRVAAGAELAAFFVLERRLRKGAEARDLDPGELDRGTTTAIGMAFGIAIVGPPLLGELKRGILPTWAGWIGVGAMAVGIGMRSWAAQALGTRYTRTLRVGPDQRVVASGPYAVVRHPGYAADIVMLVGYGLAWTSVGAVLTTALPTAAAYSYRIRVEERMLQQRFGDEYSRYRERTWRLLPGVF
jgi:protein-S-isoprenylcysteine O-methyltransferase Ste14